MCEITGIILAGGKSSRMGSNKAFVEYKGTELIQIAINTMKPVVDEIKISGQEFEYSDLGYQVISDVYDNIGPIGGLHACLLHCKTDKLVLLPCDTPNIPSVFLHELLENSKDFDAVIPRMHGYIHPLCAVYNKKIFTVVENAINDESYAIYRLLKKMNVLYVDIDESKPYFSPNIFHNVNEEKDL